MIWIRFIPVSCHTQQILDIRIYDIVTGNLVFICLVGSVNLVLKFQRQPVEIVFHRVAL